MQAAKLRTAASFGRAFTRASSSRVAQQQATEAQRTPLIEASTQLTALTEALRQTLL